MLAAPSLLTLGTHSQGIASDEPQLCDDVFNTHNSGNQATSVTMKRYNELVNIDLFKIQKSFLEQNDSSIIATHNRMELQNLVDLGNDQKFFEEEVSNSGLRSSISLTAASELLHIMQNHPVVSLYAVDEYDPEGVIGFCYGRAAFADLALRMGGVSPTAIKKLWAVGKMSNSWRFHTTTIVRVEGGQWLAIDPLTDWSNGHPENPSKPATAAEWIAVGNMTSRDKNLMYFVTDSQKLTPAPGKYSRTNMSLVTRDSIYRSEDYFFDMMNWLKKPDSQKDIKLAVGRK